jgi:hypothetical protein
MRSYVAGMTFSVADNSALVAVDLMQVSKLSVPEEYANVHRGRANVSERPSASA